MNRWVWPSAVIVALAALTLAATMVAAQAMPETQVSVPASRVSVLCPAFESVTANVRMAAATVGTGLRTSPLSTPQQVSVAGGLKVLKDVAEPMRVSAPLTGPLGATSMVSATEGPDRGLSAAACLTPAIEHWFTGVDVGANAQSEVVLANLDGSTAAVDLTVYGGQGRIPAPRGVKVEGNATETVSLGLLPRSEHAVTVSVTSSDGRVAAFVRQRTWAGNTPLGADWLPSVAAPAAEVIVPGIPAGEGSRQLSVTNPGDRTATVTIGVLGLSGPIELAGAEQVEVPAGTTRKVDLTAGLDGQQSALKLASTQPVTAGVLLDTGTAQTKHDPAFTVGAQALPPDGIWPLAAGKTAVTVLQLANPGEVDATATVTASINGSGQARPVLVPAGSTLEVKLASAATNVVRVQTGATDLRGALITTQRLGAIRGLAVVGLLGETAQGGSAQVVFDPHAGS